MGCERREVGIDNRQQTTESRGQRAIGYEPSAVSQTGKSGTPSMVLTSVGRMLMERPYDDLKETPAWLVIADAIAQLLEHQDIALTTKPYDVIGFLIRALADAGMLSRRVSQQPLTCLHGSV